MRQRRAWAAITQLHTQTRAEGEKDGRLCLFVGFDLARPVLDSHLGRESRNTQPQISGTETSKQRQQFLLILEQEKSTTEVSKRESSPSLFIFSGFTPINILSDAIVIQNSKKEVHKVFVCVQLKQNLYFEKNRN